MTDNIVDIYQCHSFYFTSYNAHTKLEKEKETENEKIKKTWELYNLNSILEKLKIKRVNISYFY